MVIRRAGRTRTTRRARKKREKADRERSAAIWQAMQDYVDANPGMAHATAYNLLKTKRPELFTDKQGRDPVERAEITREVQQKQAAIRDAIKKMQDADPHLPFTLAWARLLKQRPEMFDFNEPTQRAAASHTESPAVTQGKRLVRAQVGRDLKEKLSDLRKERPELSFAQAWEQLRKQEPGLFQYASNIENGN